MAKMTHKERVEATLAGEKADRCPVNDFSQNTMVKHNGKKWSECRFNTGESTAAVCRWLKETDTDMFFGPIETKALFIDLPGTEIGLPDDDQGSLKNTYFKTVEDIESKFLYDPSDRKTCPNFYKGVVDHLISFRKNNPTGAVSACWSEGPITMAGYLRGMEVILMDMLIEPDVAKKAIKRASEFADKIVRTTHAGNADFTICTDPVASADLINDEMYKEFALAPTKKLISGWKKDLKSPVMLHICGNTTPMLPYFVEVGTDIMSLDHAVDLANARKIVGKKMTLMGNLDPSALMQMGTPADIDAAAKKCIEAAGKDGRFILGPGCAMPRDAPMENIMALMNAAKKYHY